MNCCRRLLFSLLLSASFAAFAQDADSLILSDVETDLTFEDSLSIFNLIDSLLQQGDLDASQLALRLSYNSNVMSTGRTLGIENFGIAPGISYYHKSGFFGDVSGYWSKDFDPSYYLTVVSVGYMHDFSKYFSMAAGYDRYFYVVGEDSYVPYTNALSATPTLEYKPFALSATYSFYFGEANAHRIMPGISIIFEKKKFLNIDRVAISPAFFLLLGNETLIEFEQVDPKNLAEALQNRMKYGTRYKWVQHERKVFGLMNYAISVPLSISHKNWGFSFSYSYNIPKALPGEPLTMSESSYLSGSLTYFISMKRNKLSL
ncbi:hypothetical protein [Chryseolinea sp. H1M3-3]|uniref:hypothetical protein n=1 Tax=Chryseolinea sp. H1M3-3 TaxID=3034144 RepID=UPI0023EAB611|nr:hypothetical protein [Chryseolinea sp. H1M3-3]